MNPITISEKLMFCTVQLFARDGSCGTGFFHRFDEEGACYPVLITNRHVIHDDLNAEMTFVLHLRNGDEGSWENVRVTYQTSWHVHSVKDLCFCFVNPLLEKVKAETGKEVFYFPCDDSICATPGELEKLSALEDVVMVGYPIGLSDELNNLPVMRSGTTASHPALDFGEPGVGLVDIACWPGSSGSPIFILNEYSYRDKTGTFMGMSRIIFLGVLFAGPIYTSNGVLEAVNIPTSQAIIPRVPQMINLGMYVKVSEFDEFKSIIKSIRKR